MTTSRAFETEGMTWQERVEWAQANDTPLTGNYVLTADRGGIRRRKVLTACTDDTEATFRGMTYILNTASREQGQDVQPWSKGRIELRDPDGVLVQVMPEKES